MNWRVTVLRSMTPPPATPETAEQRRARLLARSAELRLQLGQQSAVLTRPIVQFDRARALWHWVGVRRGPLLAAGVAVTVVLVLRRPRQALGLAGSLWSLWRVLRRAAPVVQLVARLRQGAATPPSISPKSFGESHS